MAIKKASFVPKGMQRDNSVSKFNADYAYENYNIRIVAGEDNNSFSLTNEKGNQHLHLIDSNFNEFEIVGTPIGQAVIDKYLILFTTTNDIDEDDIVIPIVEVEDNPDRIYKFHLDKVEMTILSEGYSTDTYNMKGELLYNGNLNFRKYKPLETLPIYENEDILKVYWTDGFNQPRVINVNASEEARQLWNNDYFNFVRKLSFEEEFTVKKHYSGGYFSAGVIQYSYAYYTKFGQLSNIVETSPLYYISFVDRGAKADEITSNSFEITIKNPDKNFEYVRIYSMYRSSLDATPLVKKVIDLPVPKDSNEIIYTDTGTNGEIIDPTELYYIGGEEISVGTFTSKDNTLFLGDITIKRDRLSDDDHLVNLIKGLNITDVINPDTIKPITVGEQDIDINNPTYNYKNQLGENSQSIKIFKSRERYRFGLQFQHKTGKWSEPFFIQDYTITSTPSPEFNGTEVYVNMPNTILSKEIVDLIKANGYINVRPLVVYPSITERKVICQGVVCPTVYNIRDRYNNAPFAQSSWFVRPFSIDAYDKNYNELQIATEAEELDYDEANNLRRPFSKGNNPDFHTNKLVVFRHGTSIPSSDNGRNSEIQSNYQPTSSPFLHYDSNKVNADDIWDENVKDFVDTYGNDFFVDQSIVTLRSPDIEYDTDVQNLDLSTVKFRIVGYVNMAYTFSDLDLDTSTVPNFYNSTSTLAKGFYKNIDNKGIPGSTFCSAPMWLDQPTNIEEDAQTDRAALSSFIVYPFQKSGSLNNQPGPDEQGYQTSKLKYKKLFNLKYSNKTIYTSDLNFERSNQVLWNSDANTIVKIPNTNIVYKGVVDTAIINNRTYKYSVVWSNYNQDGTISSLSTLGSWNDHVYRLIYKYDGYPIITTGRRLFSKKETFNTDNSSTEGTDIIDLTADQKLIKDFWNGDYKLFYKLYLSLKELNTPGSLFKSQYKGIYGEKEGDAINSIQTNWEGFDFNRDSYFSNSPIRMKYKSAPHIAIALNNEILPYAELTNENGNKLELNKERESPYINIYNNMTGGHAAPFWDKSLTTSSTQKAINIGTQAFNPHPPAFLWLGELYRDDTNNNTMFGGDSQDAIMSNNWHVAGKTTSLSNNDYILWEEGDTYYQRYDHLNTYPFSIEEENGITDIVSFMCETRVNIDGRTDRNRSQETNHALTPNNYNLHNSVYNQKDNFFTYRVLDSDKFDLDKFPNTITWTKEKIYGEFVDTWTNITMVSTLDLEGNYGHLRALRRFNNEILSFQDTGIANILFNSRAQLSTTEGVPIELANTGKVDGKRYLSDNIGCVNKWSIASTPSGIYFIDNINRAIMRFTGQFDNLSDRLGFRKWAKSEFNSLDIWIPQSSVPYTASYDRVNNDILFINGENCLAFSETLGQFSSFYSYESTPFTTSLEDRTIMVRKDYTNNGNYKLWLHNEGMYNEFFGHKEPFYTTIICNPNREFDKIFNVVEFRADSFDQLGIHNPEDTFDVLNVWNEYQYGDQTLKFSHNTPSTLKKKFRIWRAEVPRNNGTRDRIRNPWAYFKLFKNPKNYNKLVLHDIVVYYTE